MPLIRHFVWGVSVGDPLTYGGVAALLLAVATVASVAVGLIVATSRPLAAITASTFIRVSLMVTEPLQDICPGIWDGM